MALIRSSTNPAVLRPYTFAQKTATRCSLGDAATRWITSSAVMLRSFQLESSAAAPDAVASAHWW
jgi:hypothetical protein